MDKQQLEAAEQQVSTPLDIRKQRVSIYRQALDFEEFMHSRIRSVCQCLGLHYETQLPRFPGDGFIGDPPGDIIVELKLRLNRKSAWSLLSQSSQQLKEGQKLLLITAEPLPEDALRLLTQKASFPIAVVSADDRERLAHTTSALLNS